MKTTHLYACLLLQIGLVLSLSAQSSSWLRSTTSTNINVTNSFFSSAYDGEHYYLVGEYWRDIAFDDHAFALTPDDGWHNGFITKMNTLGETVDVFNISGFDLQRVTDIAIGLDGSLWLAGLFQHEFIYGSLTVPAQGFVESFVLHLSSDGELLESYHFPVVDMYDAVTLYNIAVDLDGNIWYALSFSGDLIFDGTIYNGGTNHDGLVVKMSVTGEVLETLHFEVSEDIEEPPFFFFLDMAFDTENNLLLAGTIGGEVSLNGTQLPDVSTFAGYGYLGKFTPEGELDWWQTFVSNGSRVNSIAIDDKDRIYLGIQFEDFVVFDGETINGSLSFSDMLIARLSPEGAPQWSQLFLHGINPGTNGGVYPNALTIMDDQLLVGGTFDDWIILNNETIMDGGDRQLGYLLNMTEEGELIDGWPVLSSNYSRVNTITASPEGLLYGGEYYNAASVQNLNTSSPASAMFYGLLGNDQIVSTEKPNRPIQLKTFPNPTTGRLQVLGLPRQLGELQVRDMLGRSYGRLLLDMEGTFDVSHLAAGTYCWQWRGAEGSFSGVFVKLGAE